MIERDVRTMVKKAADVSLITAAIDGTRWEVTTVVATPKAMIEIEASQANAAHRNTKTIVESDSKKRQLKKIVFTEIADTPKGHHRQRAVAGVVRSATVNDRLNSNDPLCLTAVLGTGLRTAANVVVTNVTRTAAQLT